MPEIKTEDLSKTVIEAYTNIDTVHELGNQLRVELDRLLSISDKNRQDLARTVNLLICARVREEALKLIKE